jgi:signal transduction histidine kinase
LTAVAPDPRLPDRCLRLRPWIFGACAVWLVLAIAPYCPPLAPHRWPNPWRLIVIAFGALGESALFLMASRRAALGLRFQQALRFFGAALILVAVSDALVVLMRLPTSGPALSRINDLLELAYTGVGLLALFWLPLAPLRRNGRWLVAIDVATAVGGTALVMWVTTTLVNLSAAGAGEHARIIQYGLTTACNLVALNLILVRGLARPVPGAIPLLAATVVLEIGYWVIAQLGLAGLRTDMRPLDLLFGIDQVCYVLAALAFLTAPMSGDRARRARVMPMNPLPANAVAAVGGLLIDRVLTGAKTDLVPIAVGMVGLSLLLILRVMLASHDRGQLIRAEATTAQRLQADRVSAIRGLAGGIAHEFNNLMTVVIGTAEMAKLDAPANAGELHARLDAISAAGTRAARLTALLQTYSGDTLAKRDPVALADTLAALKSRLAELAGGAIQLEYDVDPGSETIIGDRNLIEQTVRHLVANACAAMPGGGVVRVTLRSETIDANQLPGAVLPVAPGRHEVLDITDTGVGIEPENVVRIFDPFYSSQSPATAQGLGLAVVHGVMSAHGGGIDVVSVPGRGTAIRLYFPLAPAGA